MRVRYLTILLTPAVLLLCLAWLATPAFAAQVQICHIPPGNPDNYHTITISENALSTHLAHGDLPEACNAVCTTLCDDGNACTVDDTGDCEQSGCPSVPRAPTDCDDGLACTVNTCDPASGCEFTPAVVCNAPDLCTISTCAEPEGVCLDTPVVCPEGQACNPDNGECESAAVTCPCNGVTVEDGPYTATWGAEIEPGLCWTNGNDPPPRIVSEYVPDYRRVNHGADNREGRAECRITIWDTSVGSTGTSSGVSYNHNSPESLACMSFMADFCQLP
jgi:hypothetical protein